MAKAEESAPKTDREIVTTRVIDAPRNLVFDAFTDPAHLENWWGPRGFSITHRAVDIRPGGLWKFTMHGPDGTDYPNSHVYDEIVKPEKIVLRHGGGDGDHSANFGSTITFEDWGGKTRVTMRAIFPSREERNKVVKHFHAIEGGRQTLERLSEHVAFMAAGGGFTVSRVFDAPRDLVYRVHTEAGHLKRWYGPAGMKVIKAEMDLRPGGVHHYGLIGEDGKEMWGRQAYLEIVPPKKLVFVQSFSDKDGGLARHPLAPSWPLEMLSVTTFEDLGGGKTRLTIRWAPMNPTPEEMAVFKRAFAGMTQGFKGNMDQLEAYLKDAAG